jgi:hypothetical protein
LACNNQEIRCLFKAVINLLRMVRGGGGGSGGVGLFWCMSVLWFFLVFVFGCFVLVWWVFVCGFGVGVVGGGGGGGGGGVECGGYDVV